MDSDIMDDSVFDVQDESDGFSPEVKPKAKAPAKNAAGAKAGRPAAKKMVQTTLTGAKTGAASKKRPKPESDDEDDNDVDASIFSHTPSPSSKKQKKAPAAKKSSGKPLAEIENDSMQIDSAPTGPKSKKTSTEQYQKLTQLEHIIKRPDTYIGSVERMDQKMWVFNKTEGQMENRTVSYVPGLYKIFDEIIVNAADNGQRDSSMSYLKVTIDGESGEISVENNGKGIPVEMHEKEKCYIPELIFGHLLTGSNYDDTEKKTVGGRNGYGAKLTNIFSTRFTIECQDSNNGKRYKQTWTDNMSKMEKAKITSNKTSDFVRVSFCPDYKRFGMEDGIDTDLEALLYRRVYDMAGTMTGVKVWLNGEHLKINFKSYCGLYAKAIATERGDEAGDDKPAIATVEFEEPKNHDRRWHVGFTVSDGAFQQVSFVNNIATTSGGTHVNYITDQICDALGKELTKKKKGHGLKPQHFKNHIFIFVNCLIDNPAFNSQTKEQLTTKPSAFGTKCVLSDVFLKKIRQSEAIENIMHFADKKADKMLAKSDGNKRSRISNDKLVDANLAGTKRGHECTLILTEGDSARGLAVAGRAILDPDRIGVFPLRGKLLNVRDASIDQILKNKEIENIKKFLGLKHKTTYTDTKSLRYGHLMIMADQDHDGSHIKGLLINFLEVQFPSLLRIPDFFREFITPVVKVWQGSNPKKPTKLKTFFNLPQYEEWKETHKAELRRWQYKYFKGLGTSSNEDAQVYFTNLDDHLKEFHVMTPQESELFELAFSKKKADARKEWLGNFVPGTYLDSSGTKKISYNDFVNRELILFSMADNLRSIPSMIDGLKPGQRKVMYACFKRNLVKDQKVIELAGYVSEQTSYHHGEASLQQTIIGLAQNFVGSNNVNCLEPSGNFGSRLSGGSDAASPRYIFTRLSPFARRIFSPLDEPNLEFQYEDGKMIEPKTYVPIIPMVLVNGADGIGTGWSTQIPNYHPMDIVKNIKRRMGRLDPADPEGKPFEPMMPWFRGWKGTPEQEAPGRFRFNGIAQPDEKNPNEVVVTELPIRMWTDDFKSKLEEIIRGEKTPSFIKDYKEFNDHKTVHFIIQMEEKHMQAALNQGLLDKFKLTKSIGTTNLVAFNTRGQIHKYENPEEILEEYYHYRLEMYSERKKHWLKVYDADYRKLQNQYRFIHEIIENKLVVSKKKKAVLVQELRDRKYEAFPPKVEDKKSKSTDEELDNNEEPEDEVDGGTARDYDYLLSMPIWSLTLERLERLKTQIAAKKAEYDELDALSEKDLWCKDLDEFVEEWEAQLRLDAEIQTDIRRRGRRVSKKIGAGKGRAAARGDDDYQEKKPARAKAVKVEKVPEKTQQRFTEKFQAKPKPKPKADSLVSDGPGDDFSDDDFALLGAKKTQVKQESEPPASTTDVVTGRNRRATAAKPKTYVLNDDSDDDFLEIGKSEEPSQTSQKEESEVASEAEEVVEKPVKRAAAAKPKKPLYVDDDDESQSEDDNKLLGDVGAMVKGIGGSTTAANGANTGRLSLFAMSRPADAADTTLPKIRAKPSKSNLDNDFDSHDDTNYEALAMSSPRKSTKADNSLDDFLSDDDLPPAAAISKPAVTNGARATSSSQTAAASKAKAPLSVVPAPAKKRGRPAGTKNKAKDDEAPAKAKPVPKKKAAPKAAAKQPADESDAEPAPKAKAVHLSPAAKAYAAKKAKAKQVMSDDEEDEMALDDDDTELPVARPRARPGRAAAAKAKPIYIDDDEDEEGSDAFAMDDDESD
ncbi:DNA topoisomerase 2 [Diplogelasinospora grovesii]|uniref:DNA topoisomerase 2 n=1 Tax=Diplogelasinospora grovesii TaxID=303347 RepID=A0AAN6S4L3_9PEZI|nr:DNA topoisomerase 2 [Diplogelasinospora grovesii]